MQSFLNKYGLSLEKAEVNENVVYYAKNEDLVVAFHKDPTIFINLVARQLTQPSPEQQQ